MPEVTAPYQTDQELKLVTGHDADGTPRMFSGLPPNVSGAPATDRRLRGVIRHLQFGDLSAQTRSVRSGRCHSGASGGLAEPACPGGSDTSWPAPASRRNLVGFQQACRCRDRGSRGLPTCRRGGDRHSGVATKPFCFAGGRPCTEVGVVTENHDVDSGCYGRAVVFVGGDDHVPFLAQIVESAHPMRLRLDGGFLRIRPRWASHSRLSRNPHERVPESPPVRSPDRRICGRRLRSHPGDGLPTSSARGGCVSWARPLIWLVGKARKVGIQTHGLIVRTQRLQRLAHC